MKLDRDARRTTAQFLNGLAVALVGTLVLAPVAAGTLRALPAILALAGAGLLHATALRLGKS